MELYLQEDPIIQCSCCGKQYQISKDNLDYEISFVGEFGMGARYEHNFRFDGFCEACESQFSFVLKGNEYPNGAFEYQANEADGCNIIREPALIINYIDYDILAEYEDYIAADVGELIEYIKFNPSIAHKISSRQFEELVAELFSRKGYDVTLTPPRNDGGKDIIARKNDDGISICLYIECKQYDKSNPVGVNIVRSASGVRAHDKINKAIIVTTSRFTRGAFKYAKAEEHLIQLMSLDELLKGT